MRSKTATAVALALILTLSGCATIQELIQEPEITFDGVAVRDISLVEGTFLIQFLVSNQNYVATKGVKPLWLRALW
jgi:outer membrane protein assembly factor BamE (lipoprotein component of BamABCDE complex)